MAAFDELTLDASNAVDRTLFIAPSRRIAGPSSDLFDISTEKVQLRIGRRPIARNLLALYQAAGQAVPPDLAVLQAYDLWLLTYSVGLVRAAKFHELGFETRFAEKPRVTILQVFPHTRFIKKIDGHLRSSASIELTGAARVAPVSADAGGLSIEGGGKVSLSTTAGVACNLSFSVMTSSVQATGHGDFVGRWILEKEDVPLVGDQLMAHVLSTPRDISALSLDVRAYVNISSPWWTDAPVMLRSEWIHLECELGAPEQSALETAQMAAKLSG